MPTLDDNLQLKSDIDFLKNNFSDIEKSFKRLDLLVSQHSKTISDLIGKIIAGKSLGSDNFSLGGNSSGLSQGQLLADLASAISKSSQRNL